MRSTSSAFSASLRFKIPRQSEAAISPSAQYNQNSGSKLLYEKSHFETFEHANGLSAGKFSAGSTSRTCKVDTLTVVGRSDSGCMRPSRRRLGLTKQRLLVEEPILGTALGGLQKPSFSFYFVAVPKRFPNAETSSSPHKNARRTQRWRV